MEKILEFKTFNAEMGSLHSENGFTVLTCAPLTYARASYSGRDISNYLNESSYLYVDVISTKAPFASPVINFEFWQEGNDSEKPDLTIRLSCLPQRKTCLVLPLSALNAQKIFLGRTPGRLRGFVTGVAVSAEKITKMSVGLREYWSDQEVTFGDLHFSNTMPDIEIEKADIVDELGQWAQRDWAGKTKSIAEMKLNLQAQLKEAMEENKTDTSRSSRFGGWAELQFEKTGYFALGEYKGKCLLKDPEGHAFFSTGIDVVSPEINTPIKGVENYFSWLPEHEDFAEARSNFYNTECVNFLKVNFIRTFQNEWKEAWKTIITRLMAKWGFNTVGNHSELIDMGPVRIPYVYNLMNFPSTSSFIYRDFPDVFSEEYEQNSTVYAEQLRQFSGDQYLIGYFMRNEPEWAFAENLEISAELLKNPKEDLKSKEKFIEYMKKSYAKIENVNKEWGLTFASFEEFRKPLRSDQLQSEAAKKCLDAFSYEMIKQYIKIPALALRKIDPEHLNLGMRYAFILYPNQCAGKEYFDVFSINCYKIDPSEVLKTVSDIVKMPILIGEFHFGSIDKGLGSTGIIGVETQKDRALAYQRYIEACTQNKYCIGAHWFQLYDQSCMGRFDGENYQIGMLDICNRPYEDFIAGVKRTHDIMYPLCIGEKKPEGPNPKPAKSNIAS